MSFKNTVRANENKDGDLTETESNVDEEQQFNLEISDISKN